MNICLRSVSSRLSAVLRAGALACALMVPHGGAQAQTTPVGPTATSPTAPTPFSWSLFHSGGTDPAASAFTPTATNPLPPNLLAPQLQGTPTGLVTTGGGNYFTEIPSFLIGNYDYNVGPAGTDSTGTNVNFFPNHFHDDQTLTGIRPITWSAPFTFLTTTGQPSGSIPSQGHTRITSDDSETSATTFQTFVPGAPPTPASGIDAGWTVQWATSVTGNTANTWGAPITAASPPTDTSASTATTLEYVRQPAVAVTAGNKTSAAAGYQTATWTFTAPPAFTLPATAGLYSVAFHLPDPQTPKLADGTTTNTQYPEKRISDAHYVVKLNGVVVFDTDTLDASGNLVKRAGITQTETNDPQPLAGPFALTANDVLTVTLDNTTTGTADANTYVLADSVSLLPSASAGGSARVDGSPVAINDTEFPEIADALYYGFRVTRDATGNAASKVDDNLVPYGNRVIGTTPSAATDLVGAQHRIRQLVYFGRYEGIVLTDTAGLLVDGNGALLAAGKTPVVRNVGAIYCVDGTTGDTVWRFQTSDVLNPNGTIAKLSAPVYTTPAIARINILVNGVVQTKLCVVAADENGLVYCLDAIGNRNGTANNSAAELLYNQPVYSPGALLDTFGTPDILPHAHVGNTTAYWVYRPDAARPKDLISGAAKKPDAASDLPVPAAFGPASPTIYADPSVAVSTATLAPNATALTSTGLTPNATVYVGNSNGTLYKLDATGAPVTQTTATSGVYSSTGEKYNFVLPIDLGGQNPSQGSATPTPLPTPTVGWWFSVNKASANAVGQTTNVAITSAPSIFQSSRTVAGGVTPYRVYFATSNETTNVGNVFSLLSTGPTNPNITTPILTPGAPNYNIVARPDWSYPNAYTNTTATTSTGATNKVVHAALGSISGSPVVFTNPDTTPATTSIYFAANMGPEGYQADRPAPAESGRIWAVNAVTGATEWAYPNTVDPNADNTLTAGNTLIGGTTAQTADQIAALPILGTFRNSTPAVGVVQFPATINYGTGGATPYVHADSVNTDIKGKSVPMLYVGARTGADDSSNFFALDLDGSSDDTRNMFFFTGMTAPAPLGATPTGTGFEASPLLVANAGRTADGNGGVVFAIGVDGSLIELSATPTTDVGAGSVGPQLIRFASVSGFGPFASPAIAGYKISDLPTTNSTLVPTAFIDTDWVYGADSTLGIARGITPGDRNGSGGTVDYGFAGTGPDTQQPQFAPQQLPLHVYLFDNKGTHDAKSANMGLANKIGETVAPFEWGEKVYIRISNVVPPNPPTKIKPFGDITLHMADPSDPTVYYTNGGAVQVQLSDVDASGKLVAGRGADIATINTNILADLTDPNSNGFLKENPSASGKEDNVGSMLLDNMGTGSMYLGATTYAIGDGSARKNTPGSRRQIISATQTVEARRATDDSFLQTVTLKVDVNSSPNSVTQGTGTNRRFKRIPPVEQPTFAVLNPLAVRGGGPNILGVRPATGNGTTVNQISDVVGPFAGINTSTLTPDDLPAYSNGNLSYTSTTDLPTSGVLGGDRHKKRFLQVTTATADIPHGSIGSNGNPDNTAPNATSPISSNTNRLDASKTFGSYAFDVADRSALGLIGGQISNLTVQTAPAEWNDNTTSFAGPGARVNPLPWDDNPTSYRAGNNTSLDYPGIGKQRLGHTLNNVAGDTTSVSDSAASLDPSSQGTSGTNLSTRQVQPDNVKVEVEVPKYQPANLQLYDQSTTPGGRIPPAGLTSSAQVVYPMGYVARETVYVDSNHNRRRDDGEAYRTFRVFTGVPVDMTMTVTDPTLDLGKLPQTFGVQTDAAAPLGQFMPFQYTAALAAAGKGYQPYFKPINARNDGNINLLNIHFDQKLSRYSSVANANPMLTLSALPFGSDALDAQATLSAFDMNGVTGPNPSTGALQYILRTSLDSDLAAYNRNPALVAQNGASYPGATFHKARVMDAASPLLTVPDVPHDNVSTSAYFLPSGSALTPPVSGPPALDTTTHIPTSYGRPYIGLAVPLGTSVGAYAQDVRLFEGIDPYSTAAYPDIQGTGSFLYKPLFPPVYGGVVVDGTATPASATDRLTTIGSAVTQPYSNPIRVRASIVETRVTDGSTYGNLPQVDAGPAVTSPATAAQRAIVGSADFLPTAFRNASWNNGTLTGSGALNLYWTSARTATAAAPYALIGARAPFAVGSGKGYFQANTTNGSWFDAISTPAAPAAGFNTAISIAPDQHLLSGGSFSSDGTAYAFVQNIVGVQNNPTTASVYRNNLFCYPVAAATGTITGSGVSVSSDPSQPKFGARGLKFNATFTDALPPPATGTPHPTITNNLWAFWNGGARGRSTLFYSGAATGANGAIGMFSPAGALPLPAGLSGASDPSALLSYTTLSDRTTTVPAIDVTYSGVNADGNTDVYVSRYRPYNVRTATGAYAIDANGNYAVGLALVPGPAITEQVLPDTARQFYQARDVAWARADTLDVVVNGNTGPVHLLQDITKTQNADGSYPLFAGIKVGFDRATGTAIYTIPDLPVNGNTFTATNGAVRITTVYADLVRGRVRFRTSYAVSNTAPPSRFDVPLPETYTVAATFQPQARRVTTDRRADTEPVSFIDEAYKPNEANFYNIGLRAQGGSPTNADVRRVSTARYWFIWRKSAAPGTTTMPTLYTKTQRLTVYLHSNPTASRNVPANSPVPIQLDATTRQPIITVTDTTTGTTLYDSASPGGAQVDVDWARGRLYFPLRDSSGHALEGDTVSVVFSYNDGRNIVQSRPPVVDTIHWLDELRYNDPAAQPTGDPATAVDTNEHAVSIDVAANEGSPSAFLDPLAYADVAGGAYDPYSSTGGFTNPTTTQPNSDQPHKVWLFWNSTRSGTADIFYEAVDPRFSANP